MIHEFIEIGKIVAPQGLKGEVRVYPSTDFPERFLQPGQRWLLRRGSKDPQPIKLLSGRYLDGKGLYVVQLEGIQTINDAETLREAKLMVPSNDRPRLEEGEFHIPDLIGLEVFDQATQTLVGTVISVIPAGNHLLEVQPPNPEAKPVLIPFVMEIVPIVDLQHRRLEITPPIGLIDDEAIKASNIPSVREITENS
jgi:16S rRNA processing protein RimM